MALPGRFVGSESTLAERSDIGLVSTVLSVDSNGYDDGTDSTVFDRSEVVVRAQWGATGSFTLAVDLTAIPEQAGLVAVQPGETGASRPGTATRSRSSGRRTT
ncbi:MAG: hypothetical protein AAFP86_17940 [Planctomycetota bacterium]